MLPKHGLVNDRRIAFLLRALMLAAAQATGAATAQVNKPSVLDEACPRHAIEIRAGTLLQEVVDRSGPRAVFCLKSGIHRAQAIRPLHGQQFHGEATTILNGSRLLTGFSREGAYWVAQGQLPRGPAHGECSKGSEACGVRGGVFINDRPLAKASEKAGVKPGWYFADRPNDRIYIADNPNGQKIELAFVDFAFESRANDILIKNLTVEKYANPAQKGAIHGQDGTSWTIERVEARLNNGVGVRVGNSGRIRLSKLHHNGQLGASARGQQLVIEDNEIWANNIHGFEPMWEAGGIKVVLSDTVVFRRNFVHHNVGPGIWCDIDCRNVLYEENTVEDNHYAGIFHEISFDAVIRNNTARRNSHGYRVWFWGAEILVAGSESVTAFGNKLEVSAGGCGIVLIDQNRKNDNGRIYKTRGNRIYDNVTDFKTSPCAGGTSDVAPHEENYGIISSGGNSFDSNRYTIGSQSEPARFVWERDVLDWNGFRSRGLERQGSLSTR